MTALRNHIDVTDVINRIVRYVYVANDRQL